MPSLINPYMAKVCTGNPISVTSLGANYKFNGNATDSSGNGLNGTITGSPTYSAGKYQTALTLNGSSGQYVTVTDNALLEGSAGNISIFSWVNLVSGGHVVWKTNYSAGYRLFPRPGTDTLVTIGPYNVGRGSGPSLNTWLHIGFTFNNNILKIYINGVQQGTDATLGATSLANAVNLIIGYADGVGMEGSIDELNIWQRVLTTTEITNLYNSTCPLIP